MRLAFAHEAILAMPDGADLRAPGGAITVELCGHWDHEPPCPLAPHHTSAERVGDEVRVRTLFAAEPDAEQTVRQRIDRALSGGRCQGPDGSVTRWRLQASRPGEVTAEEHAHGERLRRDGSGSGLDG
ncbi:MAG TPA: hypothetical protein VJT31_00835 [Rugosimonospora sp.]|nr:hypothetical protein [Rugosimonospora sp.]